MGTNTAETINHTNLNRQYNMVNHINSSSLSGPDKTKLLIELTGKRRTMLEGSVFMLKHPTLNFDDFDRALVKVNDAVRFKSVSYLGQAEVAFQKQIDVIRKLDAVDLSQEEKALCLYTLQNMIFALPNLELELANGKKNDYVPRILQDQYEMLLKGSDMQMNWDVLRDSTYSSAYRDPKKPTLANWKFLDLDLIQNKMKSFSQNRSTANHKQELHQTKANPMQQNNNSMVSFGVSELFEVPDAEINQILNDALVGFDANDLKNHLPEFFNFVRDKLAPEDQTAEQLDYHDLHKAVLVVMQRIVEIGNDQQRKAMLEQAVKQQQNNQEERTL